MTATITLTVHLDEAYVLTRTLRGHQPAADVIRELVGDLEASAFDALRHKDAVARLGVAADVFPPVAGSDS